ncbi:rubrerythrin family protein [Candidatus Poribacteria bacterium]|nr:rubrerythrin family protein [Candidatus Poribacteria bacterium]
MDLRGSQSERNLLTAFAGESQARNRYAFYASEAVKAGFEQIAAVFRETAENEKEHAKVFYKLLPDGEVKIEATYPISLGDTASNLAAAAEGEKMEWTTIYKDFAGIARKEGFAAVANTFDQVAKVEEFHETRYRSLLKSVKEGAFFKKDKPVKWHCRNCGRIIESKEAPKECPTCKHSQSYYEILAENY